MKVVNEYTLEMEDFIEELSEEDLNNQKNSISAILGCSPEEFFNTYQEYKQAEAKFNDLYEPFKKKLIELHATAPETANTVIVGGVKCTYVSANTRSSIDTKKLKEEAPELVKKFTKTTEVAPSIRLSNI